MKILFYGFGAVGSTLSQLVECSSADILYVKSEKCEFISNINSGNVGVIRQNNNKNTTKAKNKLVLWDGSVPDFIISTVKLNGLSKFKEFLLQNKHLQSVPIVFLQNGYGWEKEFSSFIVSRIIILINCSTDYQSKITYSSNGMVLADAAAKKLGFDTIFKETVVIHVTDIKPYLIRKVWFNTMNGLLSCLNASLYDIAMSNNIKYYTLCEQFLKETKDLLHTAKIKTLQLPLYDPEELLLFFSYCRELKILNKTVDESAVREYGENIFRSLTKGYNSTLQSIKQGLATEYRLIVKFLIDTAKEKKIPYTLNQKIYDKIEEYDTKGKMPFFDKAKF